MNEVSADVERVAGGWLHELGIDISQFWQIAGSILSLKLDGQAADVALRYVLRRQFEAGAIIVRYCYLGVGADNRHTHHRKYGTQPKEMADLLVAEWIASGRPTGAPTGPWIGLPEEFAVTFHGSIEISEEAMAKLAQGW